MRRDHINDHFAAIGLRHNFVDGVTGVGKIRGCAQSHAAAFDSVPSAPFMVFEDDVEFAWPTLILPHVPPDADVIYLGTNTGGCFPNTIENKAIFGHRSLANFTLASAHDEVYLKLHSMVSAHAILFLNDRVKDIYREQLRIANKRKTPLDVRYAYLMSELQVYALRRPMFVEAQHLQIGGKTSQTRREMTCTPLTPAKPDDIRVGVKRDRRVTARVIKTDKGNLEWSIVSLQPLDQSEC